MDLVKQIQTIPVGYSEVLYQGKRYGLSRTNFNGGKSTKLFAEELGGTDFISCNFYITSQNQHLKPCEMPAAKVMDFLNGYHPVVSKGNDAVSCRREAKGKGA